MRRHRAKADTELTFTSIKRSDVPHDRKGKHHEVVANILSDLEKLRPGTALKVPLKAFGTTKVANVRAALNRASSKAAITLGTSSDDENLYVWIED